VLAVAAVVVTVAMFVTVVVVASLWQPRTGQHHRPRWWQR
jgi:hypothetical protein